MNQELGSKKIGRRQFFKMAAVGAGGAAALLATQRGYASNDPTASALTADSFRGVARDQFRVTSSLHRHGWADLPAATRLKLNKVGDLPLIKTRHYKSERRPFSLVFSGPESMPLTSATYKLSHPAWRSTMDVFLVRIGDDAHNPIYEAVFN